VYGSLFLRTDQTTVRSFLADATCAYLCATPLPLSLSYMRVTTEFSTVLAWTNAAWHRRRRAASSPRWVVAHLRDVSAD